MSAALTSSLELVFGDAVKTEAAKIELLSDATMSRATYKLDIAHMHLRRQQWAQWLSTGKPRSVQLGLLFHTLNGVKV